VFTGGGVTSLVGINSNSAANGINSDGGRTVFGCNANQRGGINSANVTITTRVAADVDVVWDHVSHGSNFSVGLGQISGQDSTYHLLVFGDNTAGQLGTGDTLTRNTATFVSSDWYCVSAGNNHSLGVKRDGTLWAWGCNSFGQLGDGTATNRSTPVQIGVDKNWKYVSAGGDFSVAVTCGDATGFHSQMWTWGLNSSGQLGDNTTTNRCIPVQTADIASDWKCVSAGDSHVLAVRANGTLWAWGTNSQGELGNNSTVNRSSPVQVGSATKWISVSAGKCFSAAIRGDGW
jgi:alpha-tubulin suppressor-like RCC1 family protein